MNGSFDILHSVVGTNDIITVRLDDTYESLGSSVLNGGLSVADSILMYQVDMGNIPDEDPAVTLERIADEEDLGGNCVGFMTAAEIHRAISTKTAESNGVEATAFVTAGLGNGIVAGDSDTDIVEQVKKHRARFGTINIVCISSVPLDDTAKANALIVMTEAKTAALKDLGFEYTGTTTDSHTILSPWGSKKERYCGTGTDIGIAMAKAVREAVKDSLTKGGELP